MKINLSRGSNRVFLRKTQFDDGKPGFTSSTRVLRRQPGFQCINRVYPGQLLVLRRHFYFRSPKLDLLGVFHITGALPGLVHSIPLPSIQENPIKSTNVGREKDAKESPWVRPKDIKNRKKRIEIMQEKGMKTKGSYTD